MASVDAREFEKALETVRVNVANDKDALIVTIDLKPITTLVENRFGTGDRIEFRLTPSHELIVSRPSAAAMRGMRLEYAGPDVYSWNGGVPKGRSFVPPAVGTKWPAPIREAPVVGVLRFAVDQAGLWDECLNKARAAGARLWREVWRAVGPALNSHALAQAARFGLGWGKYRELRQRPDLCAFLDTAPGVGPAFRVLPRGLSWEEMVTRLARTAGRGTNDGSGEAGKYRCHPAVLTWIRRVPYSKMVIPDLKASVSLSQAANTKGTHRVLLEAMVGAAEGGLVDAESLGRLETPLQWLLLHSAILYDYRRQVRQILTDPQAAEAAFLRTFGPIRKARGEWVLKGLREIYSWQSQVSTTAHEVAIWAEKLRQPKLTWTSPAYRLQRLDTVCRRIRRMHGLGQRLDRMDYTQADLATHVPVRVLEQIVTHPDFEWDRMVCEVLVRRCGCRRSAAIRPHLIKQARTPTSLLILLKDGRPSETKALWHRLVEKAPEMAIGYLEEHGFDPRVDWQSEDLLVLFQGTPEITVRATLLHAELRRALESKQLETGPSRSQSRVRPGQAR